MIKPAWLNKKISLRDCAQVKILLKDLQVNTVCEEALCPNMGECFARRQATFIILGAICTRACGFCGVAKGKPLALDADEPNRIALAARDLGLRHAVITSVTRDDLADGGAGVFAETISCLRKINKGIIIETLIPDFNADERSLRVVAQAKPDIIAHNLETVPRLYKEVRPTGAIYERSLEVLRVLNKITPRTPLKSGLMLGLGESEREIISALEDLIKTGCSLLSIGQYLAPGPRHYPVKEYITPERFDYYKAKGSALGFARIESGPYVRSSYLADSYLKEKVNA